MHVRGHACSHPRSLLFHQASNPALPPPHPHLRPRPRLRPLAGAARIRRQGHPYLPRLSSDPPPADRYSAAAAAAPAATQAAQPSRRRRARTRTPHPAARQATADGAARAAPSAARSASMPPPSISGPEALPLEGCMRGARRAFQPTPQARTNPSQLLLSPLPTPPRSAPSPSPQGRRRRFRHVLPTATHDSLHLQPRGPHAGSIPLCSPCTCLFPPPSIFHLPPPSIFHHPNLCVCGVCCKNCFAILGGPGEAHLKGAPPNGCVSKEGRAGAQGRCAAQDCMVMGGVQQSRKGGCGGPRQLKCRQRLQGLRQR